MAAYDDPLQEWNDDWDRLQRELREGSRRTWTKAWFDLIGPTACAPLRPVLKAFDDSQQEDVFQRSFVRFVRACGWLGERSDPVVFSSVKEFRSYWFKVVATQSLDQLAEAKRLDAVLRDLTCAALPASGQLDQGEERGESGESAPAAAESDLELFVGLPAQEQLEQLDAILSEIGFAQQKPRALLARKLVEPHLTAAQLGAVFGMKPPAVRQALSRARTRLLAKLEDPD